MSGYRELKAQADELMKRVEEARLAELEVVIQEVRNRIAEYGLTASQIFGRPGGPGKGAREGPCPNPGIAIRKPARHGTAAVVSPAGSREAVGNAF